MGEGRCCQCRKKMMLRGRRKGQECKHLFFFHAIVHYAAEEAAMGEEAVGYRFYEGALWKRHFWRWQLSMLLLRPVGGWVPNGMLVGSDAAARGKVLKRGGVTHTAMAANFNLLLGSAANAQGTNTCREPIRSPSTTPSVSQRNCFEGCRKRRLPVSQVPPLLSSCSCVVWTIWCGS